MIQKSLAESTHTLADLCARIDADFLDQRMEWHLALMLRATVNQCQHTLDFLHSLEGSPEDWLWRPQLEAYSEAIDSLDDRVENHEIALTIEPVLRSTLSLVGRE